MNLKEFYPTPENLLSKILGNIKWYKVSTVLEPSAGTGNIVEYIRENAKDRYGNCGVDIDCIEKESEFKSILEGKKFKVVHDDFLTFRTFKSYDLIVMNPPFSDGDKHLIKALDMQKKTGGSVICILNAETLKNPYSNIRKDLLMRLEDINADIEYISDAFTNAERKTGVEIAVVKAMYEAPQFESLIFENLRKYSEYSDEYAEKEETDVASADYVELIVKAYEMDVEAGLKFLKEYRALRYHFKPFLKLNDEDPNSYIKKVRMKYWEALFTDTRITGKMTSNLRDQFLSRVNELKDYDFSLYNIRRLQIEMSKHLVKGIEDTIIEIFDKLSQQYSYNDEYSRNVHYYNGWTTNKAWKINKKVILPMYRCVDLFGRLDVADYRVINELRDIEKALDYLDNGKTSFDDDISSILKNAKEEGVSKNISLKYFDVTFYKKKTCHIVFKNEELLKKLNIFGSQQKGWLPQEYGRKKYAEMNKEARDVVDSFEGERSYNEVMLNKEYYILDSSKMFIEQKVG